MTDPMYAIPGSTAHAIHLTGWQMGRDEERARIIKLLTDLDVIRRDFFGHPVAFNTDGTEVIYLTGLEGTNTKVSRGDLPNAIKEKSK